MRLLHIILVCASVSFSGCSGPDESRESDAVFYREAFRPTCCGAVQKGFSYQGRSVLVVFRRHTSGVATSEPFVFVQRGSGWHCLYYHPTVRFEMDASLDGDTLSLWRLEWPDGKLERTLFRAYNLRQSAPVASVPYRNSPQH